jgi:hypothetical protein
VSEPITKKLPLCQNLRTKGMFVFTEETPPPVECDTAVWWCIQTMQSVGPDDDACHRNFCCDPTRSCYEGPSP